MLARLQETIENHQMLHHSDHIVIGLSGGADSVCLLYGLLELRPFYDLSVTAVHVHHGLRGSEADADLAFVEKLCDNLSIPLLVYHYDIKKIAASQKTSLEEAGRSKRYEAFQDAAKKCGAHKIAVAHHMNDNAETILMRLARGTGLKGLGGIAPVRNNIIRPLIEITRDEIEAYLDENNLPYVTDDTNRSIEFTRNRFRHRYLPMLAREVNPRIVQSICRTSAILREEESYLQTLAEQAYLTMANESSGCLHIDLDTLNQHPDVMKRRLLRLACCRFNPALHDISHTHVDMLLELTTGPTGKTAQLPHHLTVKREYGRLCFACDKPSVHGDPSAQSFCYPFDILSAMTPDNSRQAAAAWLWVPEINRYISASIEKMADHNSLKCLCAKEINCDKIYGILQIRSRKHGDKIHIRHVGGKKIKDYFIDQKIPRSRRDSIALVADERQIIWILDEHSIVNDHYLPLPSEKSICLQLWEPE